MNLRLSAAENLYAGETKKLILPLHSLGTVTLRAAQSFAIGKRRKKSIRIYFHNASFNYADVSVCLRLSLCLFRCISLCFLEHPPSSSFKQDTFMGKEEEDAATMSKSMNTMETL